MADFNFVTGRLATGAMIAGPADVIQLAAAGITAVIDCQAEADDATLFASNPAIAYLFNGTSDDGQPKSVDWFRKSLNFALSALARPNVKVYAHCAQGVNRGPSTAYAIMRALVWSEIDALARIHVARPATMNGIRYAKDADLAVYKLGYT